MCGICAVCTRVVQAQRPEVDVGCPALSRSILFPWHSVSHWPWSQADGSNPSDPPVSTSPSVLQFQTCAWLCFTLHMGSGTQTQIFKLCNKCSYPLLRISPSTFFFSVLGSIIHFWPVENSEARAYSYSLNVLLKISPHLGSRSTIVMWWRKSFGHIYRILYMETNTRISDSLTHFFL